MAAPFPGAAITAHLKEVSVSTASRTMRRFNRHAVVGIEADGTVVMIEDVTDSDGRMYRLEYRSTADGRRAVAYCRWNPWSPGRSPNAGVSYGTGHVSSSGLICVGSKATSNLASSPYNLEFTIRRARYWCDLFSFFKQNGYWYNPAK